MKADKRVVPALEGMLSAWEDAHFLDSLTHNIEGRFTDEGKEKAKALLSAKRGPQFHWREFRQFLLTARATTKLDSRFSWDDASVNLAAQVLSWSANSRRVFKLSKEIQSALERIELGNTQLPDLIWPFPSFVIELAEPLGAPGDTSSTILVSSPYIHYDKDFSLEFGEDILQNVKMVRTIPDAFKEYSPIDAEKKNKIERLVRQQNPKGVKLALPAADRLQALNLASRQSAHTGYIFLADTEKSLDECVGKIGTTADLTKPTMKALRIVLNFCLFLSNLEGSEHAQAHSGSWQKNERYPKPSLRSVTDGTDICTVSSFSSLLGMTDIGKGKEMRSPVGERDVITPHWRRAHMRRRPGMGHIPDAPKDVKVPQTIVNGHLLLEGQLPIGSSNTLR